MTGKGITVSLDIKDESLRGAFEAVLAAQGIFRLHNSEEPGFPQLCILEMDQDPLKTFALIRSILSTTRTTEIFVTSPRMEPAILLEALRTGVKEFIPQPLDRDEFEQALQRCLERHQQDKPAQVKLGKLFNIMGSKGGVGTTTIAVNLAISLQEANDKRSVVLVDLNPHFGDAALFLDLEPAHTFSDIAKNMARLDTTFLMSVLSKHPSGLYLLPSVQVVEEMGLLTPESVQKTLELLQASFDYVVVDSGHTLDDITLAPLRLKPDLFLVSTLTLPAMRNTRRLLDIFTHCGYAAGQINIIVNRYKSKNKELSLHDAEDVLQQKAFWLLPNDYFAAVEAINKGKPISSTARKAEITRSFKNLASVLTNDKDIKSSFFRKIFK